MNRVTHGGRRTRLYNIWRGMKRRCFTPTDIAYPRYGGRGITVCAEWAKSYEVFRCWALANDYADDLTLDRKDNDLGYFPDNCRWATYAQQNRNYSRVRFVNFEGERVALIDLAERFGIKPHTLRQRVFKYGMSVVEALSLGAPKPETVTIGGNSVLLSDACVSANLPIAIVRKRIRRGWDAERALRP
jgi:hypothetical protein